MPQATTPGTEEPVRNAHFPDISTQPRDAEEREERMKGEMFDVGEYVEQMAVLIDLQLQEEYRAGVVENFERIVAQARLVNEFRLPASVEAGVVFEP